MDAPITKPTNTRPNNKICRERNHMTPVEYALYTFARQVSYESKQFYFDGRKTAAEFLTASKDTMYRASKRLKDRGWFIEVRPAKRLKNGMFCHATFEVLTHEEWIRKHGTGKCKIDKKLATNPSDMPKNEIDLSQNETGQTDLSQNENDLSQNEDIVSRDNLKENLKGECESGSSKNFSDSQKSTEEIPVDYQKKVANEVSIVLPPGPPDLDVPVAGEDSPLTCEFWSLSAQLKLEGLSVADIAAADGVPITCQKDLTPALLNLMRRKVVELQLHNGETFPVCPSEMWIEMCLTIKSAPPETKMEHQSVGISPEESVKVADYIRRGYTQQGAEDRVMRERGIK